MKSMYEDFANLSFDTEDNEHVASEKDTLTEEEVNNMLNGLDCNRLESLSLQLNKIANEEEDDDGELDLEDEEQDEDVEDEGEENKDGEDEEDEEDEDGEEGEEGEESTAGDIDEGVEKIAYEFAYEKLASAGISIEDYISSVIDDEYVCEKIASYAEMISEKTDIPMLKVADDLMISIMEKVASEENEDE